MKRKVRKIPTPQSLAKAAERYLERYASSEASLVRVLQNALRRAAMDNPDFASDKEGLRQLYAGITQIVEKYKKAGILSDAAYAEMKVDSLRRRGLSRSAIEKKLGMKGVSHTLVSTALKENAAEATPEEAELKAARAFAKRKRLGPYRKGLPDQDQRRKDLAALSRAGFSYDIARRVMDSAQEGEEE